MDDESLQREIERLREEVAALERRLERLEAASDDGGHGSSGTEAAPGTESEDSPIPGPETADSSASDLDSDATAVEPGGDPAETDPESESLPAETDPESGSHPAGTESTSESNAASDSTVESADDGRNWEVAVGIRWFGLAGSLALVVGVVFFVQLAIDTGLLGPLGRVAVGTIGGAALFGGGRYAATRQRYVRWGRIASGAGLAVAYFSLYAAYGFETYRETIGTPLWAVLVALTVLVAVTALVSVRDGAPLVVGEAFLLGYVTASLSTDAATLVVTPVYVLLLAAGLVAIATVRPWSRPVVSSTFATYGVLALWLLDVDPPAAALAAVTAVAFPLYLFGGYVLRGSDRVTERRYRIHLIILTVVNAVAAALFLELSVRDAFPEAAVEGLGLVAVAIALAGAYTVVIRRSSRRDVAAAAGSVVLLVGGLQMALEPLATTVVALAVVCGAVGLSFRSDVAGVGFRAGAHVVAGVLVLKLLAVDATALSPFDAADPLATLTGRPASFALAVATFYALSRWFSIRETSLTAVERRVDRSVTGSYAVAATGLGVIGLALELSGTGISVAWALYGFTLLGIGLSVDRLGVRVLGIAVLVLATAKVFLLDTSDLDTVARTISFLVLGAVLLAASYSYARSRGDLDLGYLPDRK
ncbi:DUF2339 domain-containing protein [Natronorubrum sp. FCH18a]|uniref:DUF2339 domain-containing protein n=1 Tax=Natronorubrum sp. FCH18a TaxID=3447018 RepID=UPI003F515F6B